MFSSSRDIVQAALKWQRARDESGIKGMMAQLESEDTLYEIIKAYNKENK